MRRTSVAAWLFALLAVAGFFAGVIRDDLPLRLATKPWPVLIMAAAVFAAARHRYGRWLGAGLLASVAGDVLLELGNATFLAGVGAFLVAHVLYTVAYLGRSRVLRPVLALPFVVWGVVVVGALRPGLAAAGMLVPVIVYTTAIMTMLWRAAACWERDGVSRTTVLAFVGALLFAASDTMIAIERFSAASPDLRYPVMILYWLGQLGITYSALRHRSQDRG